MLQDAHAGQQLTQVLRQLVCQLLPSTPTGAFGNGIFAACKAAAGLC
jgi:hypothetical protein